MVNFPKQANSSGQAGKMLVAYFSVPETTNPNNMTRNEENSAVVIDGVVLGNTQYVANLIAEQTNADIFRIEPTIPYPVDHVTLIKATRVERDNGARPELATSVENIGKYDVVFVGFPNWFDDMPMILYTFLENADMSGKTVVPFCTHGGSGFSDTINIIARLLPDAHVEKNGYTVSRDVVHEAKNDVIAWLLTLFTEHM